MDGQNINWTDNRTLRGRYRRRLDCFIHTTSVWGFFLLFLMHASEQEEDGKFWWKPAVGCPGNCEGVRSVIWCEEQPLIGQLAPWWGLWLVPGHGSCYSQCRILIRAEWWSPVSRKLGPRKTRQNISGSIILMLDTINDKRELGVSGKSPKRYCI